MKIETELREDHQMKVTAELDAEVLEQFKHRAARKISKETKIPGFRPGKAPYDIVKRMVGDDLLEREAVELMVDEYYPEVLREADLKPSGPGSLEDVISMNPPKFAFLVPLAPEVELGDYQSIRKDYEPPVVTDEEVDQVIKNLQSGYATAEPVERPAQEGDLLAVKVDGRMLEPEEGQEAEIVKDNTIQVIVGDESQADQEWPYPGFSKELVGLSANDVKVVQFTFSEESPYERLRGKQAEFTAEVQSVKAMTYPELDDEFAQSLGEFDSFANLKATIREQLEENHKNEYDQEYLSGLIDEIVAMSTVKYPPHYLEEEVEHVVHSLEDDLSKQQLDLDTYFKLRQTTREEFIENEAKPVARNRLGRSLVMNEISRQEKIELQPDELEAEVSQAMDGFQDLPEFKKIKTTQEIRNLANMVTFETANRLMNQRIMDRLKDIATGKATQATGEEETAPAPVEDVATETEPPSEAQGE
ncbi:MAG: trigger factor [Chloroflexi bacterium]|nr:trigger factor [Anaerolineaceae bacterium]NMB88980.1 trigger factor [Chloroflexota bacterium]